MAISRSGILMAAITTFTLLSVPAFAQEEALTLMDAYKRSLSTHEDVLGAKETLYQAEASLDKASAQFLPTVAAEGSYTVYSEEKSTSSGFTTQPDNTTTITLSVSQPLYEGGRSWSSRTQAQLGIERAKAYVGYTRESVMLMTAGAFYKALKSQKDIEIKTAALKRAVQRRGVAEVQLKVGEVTKAVLLRAEADVAGAEAELTRSNAALRDSITELKRIIGERGDIRLVEPAHGSMGDVSVEALVEKAQLRRLDLKTYELDSNIAEEAVAYAKGAFLPSLSLEGVYQRREQSPETTFFQEDTMYASLVLSYPIFEGGLRRAELREARSKAIEARLKKKGLKNDLEVEVRSAYNDMETAKAVIESYRRQAALAEEEYRMVFEQFKHGLATSVDVTDADATLISAERSLLNSVFDLELAILNVKYFSGLLLDELGNENAAAEKGTTDAR